MIGAEFFEGCSACASGALRSTNPNPPNTPAWGRWQRGWMDEFSRLPQVLQEARAAREPALLAGQDNG